MNLAMKILAGILTGILALACLIPSLSVNITAHAVKGEAWHAGAIYIVAVVAAAVFIIARRIAKRHKENETARVCIILVLVLLSFNTKNAWNSSMIARAEFGDPRRLENDEKNRLHGEEKILTKMLYGSDENPRTEYPRASRAVQADINAKLLDPKAEGCIEGGTWNGPVTKIVCPEVAKLRTEKAAAEDYETKVARLAVVQGKLEGKRGNTVTDPTVQNIGAVLGLAMTVTETTQKAIGMGDDLHVALVVESLAIFGPDICFFLFLMALVAIDSRVPRNLAVERVPALPAEAEIITVAETIVEPVTIELPEQEEPEPLRIEGPRAPQKVGGKVKTKKGRNVAIPTCVQSFFDANVTKTGKPADSLGATEFFDAYAATTQSPVTSNMFGRCASAVFDKAEGRTNRYVGVKLRGVRNLRSVK